MSVSFSPCGGGIASASRDGTIKVWDLRNPNYSRSFDSKAGVNCVTLRTDRDEFISGDQNGYVKVWDLAGNGTSGCLFSIKPSSARTIDEVALDQGAGAYPIHHPHPQQHQHHCWKIHPTGQKRPHIWTLYHRLRGWL